ncbi:MAG: hypothetical protein QOF35_1311, partial [Actinomycetota bacterium]|nr:hypothetical protein [Actinomycetota bacterium]
MYPAIGMRVSPAALAGGFLEEGTGDVLVSPAALAGGLLEEGTGDVLGLGVAAVLVGVVETGVVAQP